MLKSKIILKLGSVKSKLSKNYLFALCGRSNVIDIGTREYFCSGKQQILGQLASWHHKGANNWDFFKWQKKRRIQLGTIINTYFNIHFWGGPNAGINGLGLVITSP